MGKLGALEHGARMTVLCVNTQRQEPCCSVAFLKVSLIGAENKGETACLRAKSHVPAHLIQAPLHARVVQALRPFLLNVSEASGPRKGLQASRDSLPQARTFFLPELRTLVARLRQQSVVKIGRWERDERYQDVNYLNAQYRDAPYRDAR